MSKSSYKKNDYYIHTFLCTWTNGDMTMRYEYTYSGDVLDGIIRCYKDVVWSKMPDFHVSLKESKRV